MKARNPSSTKAQLLAFVIWGALITLLLTLIKLYVEQGPVAHRAELLAYDFLQNWVPPYERAAQPLSVVVLDIGRLPGGKGGETTDRKLLLDLVRIVIDQGPQAVAVDIDFSPDKGWWRDPLDPKFFEFCLEQRRKDPRIPVFLGVYQTTVVPPDAWLGVPKYKELAVGLGVPPIDTRRIPLWIQLDDWQDHLPSLSAALADVRGRASTDLPRWLQVATDAPAQGQRTGDNSGYAYADILVDYTRLEQLKRETIDYIPTRRSDEPVLSRPETLKDRLVIIGDVTDATDTFSVPGHDGQFPGVYLHASAVHTLTTHPVFEFTPKARHSIEIGISALIILSAAFIRHRHHNDPEVSNRRQRYLTIGSFVFVMVGVIVLVRYYDVFWFDFHLAVIGLFLHVKLERVIETFRHLRRRLKETSKLGGNRS